LQKVDSLIVISKTTSVQFFYASQRRIKLKNVTEYHVLVHVII